MKSTHTHTSFGKRRPCLDTWDFRMQPIYESNLLDFPQNWLITKWVFPKIGVPQNGWLIMENPMKMDDLGVPLFSETSKCCPGVLPDLLKPPPFASGSQDIFVLKSEFPGGFGPQGGLCKFKVSQER